MRCWRWLGRVGRRHRCWCVRDRRVLTRRGNPSNENAGSSCDECGHGARALPDPLSPGLTDYRDHPSMSAVRPPKIKASAKPPAIRPRRHTRAAAAQPHLPRIRSAKDGRARTPGVGAGIPSFLTLWLASSSTQSCQPAGGWGHFGSGFQLGGGFHPSGGGGHPGGGLKRTIGSNQSVISDQAPDGVHGRMLTHAQDHPAHHDRMVISGCVYCLRDLVGFR